MHNLYCAIIDFKLWELKGLQLFCSLCGSLSCGLNSLSTSAASAVSLAARSAVYNSGSFLNYLYFFHGSLSGCLFIGLVTSASYQTEGSYNCERIENFLHFRKD